MLQNNFANGEGGGVYLNGGAATENHLFLTENAVIRHCEAGTAGGGIYASFRNPDVPQHPAPGWLLSDYRQPGRPGRRRGGAASAAGPGRVSGCPGELTLEGCVLLTDNTSTGAGGGLAYLNDAGDSGYQSPVPIRLVLGGETQITDQSRGGQRRRRLRSQHPSRRQRRCAGQRAADREHRQHGRRPFPGLRQRRRRADPGWRRNFRQHRGWQRRRHSLPNRP